MSKSNNPELVLQNYAKPDNLLKRMNLHTKYGKSNRDAAAWFEKYNINEGCSILELGCGTGAMWEGHIDQLPEGSALILTDLSQGMIDMVTAKFSHFQNVSARVMDIQSIEYNENSFDIVIANFILHHVPDLAKAIAEVYRVLKPGGIFYAATFGANGQNSFFNQKLKEFDPELNVFDNASYIFMLQNGREVLKKSFTDVICYEFSDSLDVTDTADIMDYLLSTTHFSNISKEKTVRMKEFFDGLKDINGIVRIPRQYGTFIAQK